MRYLIVSLHHAPELTGIGKYTGEMVAWLVSKGHEVRVVSAAGPFYPAWKVAKGYSPWRYSSETIDGAVLTRCPVFLPKKITGLTRILFYLSFALTSTPAVLLNALFWRPGVVMTIEPPLFAAPGVWLAARFSGAKPWLHIQDFEIDAAFDLGILKPGPLRRFALGFERFLMQRFDRVSTISGAMLGKLREKGVEEKRSVFFPNWVDTEVIKPLPGRMAVKETFGINSEHPVLLYSGNMGKKQGLEIIIESARALSHEPKLLFLLCGDGIERKRLEEMAKGLKNVRFLPLQPEGRLNELLNMADIHLLPQRAAAESLVLPSKLISIMASGRPVIATATSGSELAALVSKCGEVVEPGDSDRFAAAIKAMLKEGDRLDRLGSEGRALSIKNWSKEEVLKRAFAQEEESR